MSSRARRARVAAWAAALGLAAAGCSTADADTRAETAGLPATREEIEDHVWRLEPRRGDAGPVTLEIDGRTLVGTSPCGTYRARIAIDRAKIDLSGLSRRARPCDDAERRAVEHYLAELGRATSTEVDDDHLVIEGDDVRLAYEEVPDG